MLISMTTLLVTACADHTLTNPPPKPPPPPPPPPPGAIAVVALTTYDGSGQAVHPDAVTTPDGWGSESNTTQLVVTPYPEGNATYENPSIFISTSNDSWSVPDGIQNPIVHPVAGGYLSDPDELYNPSTNELWLYYRQVTTTNDILLIRSSDGVRWSAPVTVLSVPNHQAVSPTVVRVSDTDWWLWTVNSGGDGCTAASTTVERRHSTDGIHWSDPELTQLGGANDFPWHLDVSWIQSQNSFWALYNAKVPGSCTTQVLRFATSTDGQHWTTAPTPLIRNGVIPEFADIVYRASLMYNPSADAVTLWYSGARYINSAYEWHVATQQMSRATLFATVTAPSATSLTTNDGQGDQTGNDTRKNNQPLPYSLPPLTNATAP